jgi:hypothetical protein
MSKRDKSGLSLRRISLQPGYSAVFFWVPIKEFRLYIIGSLPVSSTPCRATIKYTLLERACRACLPCCSKPRELSMVQGLGPLTCWGWPWVWSRRCAAQCASAGSSPRSPPARCRPPSSSARCGHPPRMAASQTAPRHRQEGGVWFIRDFF